MHVSFPHLVRMLFQIDVVLTSSHSPSFQGMHHIFLDRQVQLGVHIQLIFDQRYHVLTTI